MKTEPLLDGQPTPMKKNFLPKDARNKKSTDFVKQFDSLASTYESYRLSGWYQAHNQLILKSLKIHPQDTVLDIGCGTGWLLRKIAKTCNSFTGIGIDISSQMIAEARKKAAADKLSNLLFINDDWEAMPADYPSLPQVNLVVCASAFHYFSNPLVTLQKVCARLRPGGKLYLLERNMSRSLLTRLWGICHRLIIKDHVTFYKENDLIDFIHEAGFKTVRVITRVEKWLWENKFYTNIVLIEGEK